MQNSNSPINILYSISQSCQSNQTLSLDLIKLIDNMSASYSSSYDQQYINLCHQAWLLIEKSNCFWDNTILIISNTISQHTILQALILMHNRIKTYWAFENKQIRDKVKNTLCSFAMQYETINQSNDKSYKAQFHKINCIIAQILKYQWNSQWVNFLKDLLIAMQERPGLAQNYFDLIRIIFQEVFAENDKLTSRQMQNMRQNINQNSVLLFSTFQTFFNSQQPISLIKNCLLALQAVIQKIQPQKVYLNLSFEKMIALMVVPELQICVVDCLIAIFQIKYDIQLQRVIKSKVILKKQSVLIQILQHFNPEANQNFRQKIVDLCSYIVDDLLNQVKNIKQNEKRVQFEQGNILISAKLSEILTTMPVEKSDIKVYSFIVQHARNFNCKTLIRKLVSLTLCPVQNTFFIEQKIFNQIQQYYSQKDEQIFQIQKIIGKLIKSVSHNQYLTEIEYTQILFMLIPIEINTSNQMIFFCRLCWNYYILMDYCQNIYQGMLLFLNAIRKFESARKIQLQDEKKRIMATKMLLASRANFLLICSHKKAISISFFRTAFFQTLKNCFYETDSLVCFSIDVLKQIASNFSKEEIIQQVINKYVPSTKNRATRMQLDKKLLNFLCDWIDLSTNPISSNIDVIHQIISPYQQRFKQILQRKAKAKNDLNGLKLQLIQIGYKLLSMYEVILKNQKIISQLSDNELNQLELLMILKQTSQQIRETSKAQKYRIYALSVQNLILLNVLPTITPNKYTQTNKRLLNTLINNINNQMKLLDEISIDKYDQDNQQLTNMLTLITNFIDSINRCCWNQQQRYKIVLHIINHINNLCFDCLNIAYLKYLIVIVKSRYFNQLENDYAASIFYQIFDYAKSQKQHYIQLTYDIFSEVLTNKADEINNSQNVSQIEKFIIDFTCKLFKIIISPFTNKYFLDKFLRLLYFAFELLKNMSFKFHHLQQHSNFYQVCHQLSVIIRKQYGQVNGNVLDSLIEQSFRHKIKAQQNFQSQMKDFLVELRRGFIETRI